MTRARRQVVLYASFAPEDLRVEATQSVGIKHLRAYLELADRGPDTWAAGAAEVRTRQDRHRDDVADALRGRGIAVTTDVGLSDFRIDLVLARSAAPDDPLVAVLLDGPEWAARRTVSDRDGLPVQVLGEMMGWPAVERVWMPEWLVRRDEVIQRLDDAVRMASDVRKVVPSRVPAPSLAGADLRSDPPPPSRTSDTAGPDDLRNESSLLRPVRTTSRKLLPGQEVFEAFRIPSRGSRSVLDELPSSGASAKVRRTLEAAVLAEGPIHVDRLVRHVALSYDLSRVNAARSSAILAALPAGLKAQRDDPFVWPAHLQPQAWEGFRSSDGEDRSFDHVPLREIANAMVALCRQAAGASSDELDMGALGLFGGRRRTAGIAARLATARERAVAEGRLEVGFNGMHRASE